MADAKASGTAELNSELLTLLQGMGPDVTSRMLQMDVNRGVVPGAKTPGAENLSPEQLALMDRYIWGQQSGLGVLPAAAYSELVKVPLLENAIKPVTSALGTLTGFGGEQAKQWYAKEEGVTSPASVNNLLAALRGALAAGNTGPVELVIGDPTSKWSK
jgi:hypothetical protein